MKKGEREFQLCKGTANTSDCGFKYWANWEQGFFGAGVVQDTPILTQDWECDGSTVTSYPSPILEQRTIAATMKCVHRGDEQREEVCPTCRGSVRVKIYGCAVLGECTIAKKIGNLAVCQGCASYSA